MNNHTDAAMFLLNERSRLTIGRDIVRVQAAAAVQPLPPEPVASTARRLGDWLADSALLCAPPVVIPHLVVKGRVTLLSGREKIGKSTLVAGAVALASRGESVLGVPVVQPVPVLWYALDEHVADAVRRFEGLAADARRVIINKEPRTVAELLAALERDTATFPGVVLVVVDTLSRVFAASGVDPNSSHEVEPVIARLVDWAHHQDIAVILLYHTGKAGREYRGSTAIGATVDDILTLRRRGQADEDDFDDETSDDGRRLLVQDGRNLRGRLHLTCVAGVYAIYEDALPPRARILEALRDHGTASGRGELVKLAGVRKADGLRTVADLIAEGSIIEQGRNLKLGVSGIAALGSRGPEVPAASGRREPAGASSQVASSREFPEGGTAPEPGREPLASEIGGAGSRFLRPHPTETGTETAPDAQPLVRRLI